MCHSLPTPCRVKSLQECPSKLFKYVMISAMSLATTHKNESVLFIDKTLNCESVIKTDLSIGHQCPTTKNLSQECTRACTRHEKVGHGQGHLAPSFRFEIKNDFFSFQT